MAFSPEESVNVRETNAYLRAADTGNTGVDFSSWSDWLASCFDHRGKMVFHHVPDATGPMRFTIPGVNANYPDFVRTSNTQREGTCILLPRRTGGPAGEYATWEVLLCLREEEMSDLCFPTELGGWAHRVLAMKLEDVLAMKM